MKHLSGEGERWPLCAAIVVKAVNTFALPSLSVCSPFQLVLVWKPLDLLHLVFPRLK